MPRFLFGLILGLLLASIPAAAQVGTRPAGSMARPLFTADSTTPPLIAPCDVSVATVPLLYWQQAGDAVYRAVFVATGSGLATLVAGPHSASTALPCNPCSLSVPAFPTGGPVQVSLTVSGATCPAGGAQVSGWGLFVGP